MTDGSHEADTDQGLDESAALEVLREFEGEAGLETLSDDVGEAEATEVTETEAIEERVPEGEAEGSGEEPVSEPEPEGDAKTEEPSGPDLTHLPGDLREALRGQPDEVQKSMDKAFRSFQAGYNRDKTALQEREDTFRAEQAKSEELLRFGESFQQILSNDETADEALALARRVRVSGVDDPADGSVAGILDAPDDETMEKRLDAAIDARVEARLKAANEPAQQEHAMKAAVAASAQEAGVTAEHKDLFWATVDALDADAKAKGWELTPENIDGYLGPRLALALAKTPQPVQTTTEAKPVGTKGRKAASIPRDSNATTRQSFHADRIAAENRQLEDEDIEALAQDVAAETGMTPDEIHKVLRSGRG